MNKQNKITYGDDGIYNNNNNNTLISIFLLKKKTKRELKNFILTYLDIVCTKILDSSCLD